jgi:hypothetical protein
MAEFQFLISGDGYGSDRCGIGDNPSKFLHNAHDISVTVGPDELSKLLHDSTRGALFTEQEPWKIGEQLVFYMNLNFIYVP